MDGASSLKIHGRDLRRSYNSRVALTPPAYEPVARYETRVTNGVVEVQDEP